MGFLRDTFIRDAWKGAEKLESCVIGGGDEAGTSECARRLAERLFALRPELKRGFPLTLDFLFNHLPGGVSFENMEKNEKGQWSAGVRDGRNWTYQTDWYSSVAEAMLAAVVVSTENEKDRPTMYRPERDIYDEMKKRYSATHCPVTFLPSWTSPKHLLPREGQMIAVLFNNGKILSPVRYSGKQSTFYWEVDGPQTAREYATHWMPCLDTP